MKPILFNTEMVRAILNGEKTQTRRIMKPQPMFYNGRKYIFKDSECPKKWEQCDNIIDTYRYQKGDILYIRETWGEGWEKGTYIYKADDKLADNPLFEYSTKLIYRPSIHMPKEAARIFLRVTDIRIEKLQDIDCSGALAEGCDGRCDCPSSGTEGSLSCITRDFSIERFQTVWDKTIKKSELNIYGWSANPWVWVIEFEKVNI
nr:MAG TPA: ASCH domain protein [Caudoviricetes sp.]